MDLEHVKVLSRLFDKPPTIVCFDKSRCQCQRPVVAAYTITVQVQLGSGPTTFEDQPGPDTACQASRHTCWHSADRQKCLTTAAAGQFTGPFPVWQLHPWLRIRLGCSAVPHSQDPSWLKRL